MIFKLSPELVDLIIFAMENQKEFYFFDTQDLKLVEDSDIESKEEWNEERFIPLPTWSSTDGFQLMENFVASLRNPIIREQLRSALSSGRGVFRSFKDVLKKRPDIERLWFSFKEKEMKSRVVEWFESQSASWEVESLGPEPEETEELVLTDFTFSEGASSLGGLAGVFEYDKMAFEEQFVELPEEIMRYEYEIRSRAFLEEEEDRYQIICGETPSGDFAGFILALEEELPPASIQDPESDDSDQPLSQACSVSRILQIYVLPEYRGLGLADTLVDRYVNSAAEHDIRLLFIEGSGTSVSFIARLQKRGFESVSSRSLLDVRHWMIENGIE